MCDNPRSSHAYFPRGGFVSLIHPRIHTGDDLTWSRRNYYMCDNARFTLQWFLGEKLPISRREIGEKSARFTLQWFIGEKSAISRRDIAEKISGPTERHVISHVIDLAWHLWILDNGRPPMKKTNRVYIHKFVVTCRIDCMWATDSYTWKLSPAENDDCEWGAIINIIHAVSYARMLCWYNVGASCIWWKQNSRISSAWTRQHVTSPWYCGAQDTKLRLVIAAQPYVALHTGARANVVLLTYLLTYVGR